MIKVKKGNRKVEFGDFQTPIGLARQCCSLLSQNGLEPVSVLEPTCGKGSFLVAALEYFPTIKKAIGLEINDDYVRASRQILGRIPRSSDVCVIQDDFFAVDWRQVLESLPEPLLIIGNPPWVTNATLGTLGSCNLPPKSNFQNRRGIDAMTGNSNFDISEWMLIQTLEWTKRRHATIAMLCKTAVARKVLLRAWGAGQFLERSALYRIDAQKYFGASVDACLLIATVSARGQNFDCQVYDQLTDNGPSTVFGYRKGHLVAKISGFERWEHLEGEEHWKWRSGVKHDCAKVMEFREENGRFRNGLGELVDLEKNYLYPMLKSSDIATVSNVKPTRWMLVTQKFIGQDTFVIRRRAPKTWEYLKRHADLLDRRASAIYRKQPQFSVFGVGEYSFAPWKVAISGFYKNLQFVVIGSSGEKPIVLDDTCNFLACRTREQALYLAQLVNSKIAKEFFSAMVFWDAKRPITISLLRHLNLLALAQELGSTGMMREYLNEQQTNTKQMSLFGSAQLCK
ncbi:SAM-dependent DNA methyltransferase [bacterium]|nr:SAM-dependent DNA methyltransferase [bacterium]